MSTSFDARIETLPGQQSWGDTSFPIAFHGDSQDLPTEQLLSDACTWAAQRKSELEQLATQHGGVLFRNFPFETAEHFDAFIGQLGIENFPYRESLSNAVRVNFTDRVFSANEAPPSVKIFLHHEMAQTPLFPTRILFFCETAAEEGGATPICRSDVLFEQIDREKPQFTKDLEAKGLKYSNVMPGVDDPNSGMGRSWQSTLGVDSKEAAETRLHALGYSWEWHDDDCLRATTPILPAVRVLSDGRKTLFNQLIAAYSGWSDERNDPSSAIRHGDESKLCAEAVAQLIEIADEISFDVQWQSGDAVLLDNTVAMHGRRPFSGKRRVLASLGNMQTHSFSAPAAT